MRDRARPWAKWVPVAVALVAVLGGCATEVDGGPQPAAPPSAATASDPTSSPEAPTTTLPRLFEVATGPVDGQYTSGTIPVTTGGVRPAAVVTMNGVRARVEYCGRWWDWDDVHCWTFGGPDGVAVDAEDLGLRLGVDEVVLAAAFDDGDVQEVRLVVHYDPSLVEADGWLVDLVPGDPVMAVVDFVDLEPGEDDGIDEVGERERRTIPLVDDAVFIILTRTTISARPPVVLGLADVADLVEREKAGAALDDLWWGRLLPDDDRGVPSTFLLTTDGALQQMEQWWSP